MKNPAPELLAIGSIVKVFGIKGHVVVHPMTDVPARFHKLRSAFIGSSDATARPMGIEQAVVEPRGVRLKLAGVNDRTAAERLVGCVIFVDEEHRIRIPKGHYFVHDIVGLSVLDQDGRPCGTLREVMKLPAHDVYVVNNGESDILVPAVKEFVLKIDLASRTMKVKLIEGMAEKAI